MLPVCIGREGELCVSGCCSSSTHHGGISLSDWIYKMRYSSSHFRTCYVFIRWQENAKHSGESAFEKPCCFWIFYNIMMFSEESRNKENYFYSHPRKLSCCMFCDGAIRTLTCDVPGYPALHVWIFSGCGALSCVQVEEKKNAVVWCQSTGRKDETGARTFIADIKLLPDLLLLPPEMLRTFGETERTFK